MRKLLLTLVFMTVILTLYFFFTHRPPITYLIREDRLSPKLEKTVAKKVIAVEKMKYYIIIWFEKNEYIMISAKNVDGVNNCLVIE